MDEHPHCPYHTSLLLHTTPRGRLFCSVCGWRPPLAPWLWLAMLAWERALGAELAQKQAA